MTETRKPRSRRKPADSARSPGQWLKEAITSMYVLNPAEQLLLDQAAELADVLDKVNRQVAAEETLTRRGAKGNSVASPLLLAQRRHSEVLVRLLEGLALPDLDEDEGELSSTRKARKAALIRWSKEARR